jgi:predicted RNA binding protein YcfA (HicA-like mRNA interferase family)
MSNILKNMKKELRKIINPYLKQGWRLVRNNNHMVFKHENGGVVTVSRSASTERAAREIEQDFRRETIRMAG